MNEFVQLIYNWYHKNKRDLPWRKTKDPYRIWISEIILQQTRVDQGLVYYQNFTAEFPNIGMLAAAHEEQVLKIWQGLGYYSRARNLHSTAKAIVSKHQGRFPQNYSDILALKGIGPYTAAAIASIAFNLPHPVLDGNVNRFLSRHYGITSPTDSVAGKKELHNIANQILEKSNPGFHNEALMEFGALQCVPGSPDCLKCPVTASCFAYNHNKTDQLPVKGKKTGRKFRYLCYYLIESERYIWIEKRTANDIWKNLYQFPVVETPKELTPDEIINLQPDFLNGCSYTISTISAQQKHVLSHQTLIARLVCVEIDGKTELNPPYGKIPKHDFNKFPVPRLIEKLSEISFKNKN